MFYQISGSFEYFAAALVLLVIGAMFWQKPEKALAWTIFLLPVYLLKIKLGAVSFTFLDAILSLTLVLWALKNKKKFSGPEATTKIIVIGAFLVLLAGLAIWPSGDQARSLGLFKSLICLPLLAALAYQSILVRGNTEKSFFLRPFFYSSLVVSGIAFGYKLAGVVSFDNRLAAFWQSPNQLAMYLGLGILAGAALVAEEKQTKQKKTLVLFGLAWLFLIGFFTFSLGAIIAVLGALTCWFVGQNFLKNKRVLGAVFLVGYFLAGCFLLFQGGFLKSRLGESFDSRLVVWQVAKDLIERQPWLGIGLGNFQQKYLEAQDRYAPYPEWAVPHAHNLWLDFWLNFGFFGWVLFVFLVIIFGWCLLKKTKPVTSGLVFGQMFFYWLLISGLADEPLWRNDLAIIFWLVLIYNLRPYKWLSYWLTKKRYCLSSETNKEAAS